MVGAVGVDSDDEVWSLLATEDCSSSPTRALVVVGPSCVVFEASMTTLKVEEARFEGCCEIPDFRRRVEAVEVDPTGVVCVLERTEGSTGSPTGAVEVDEAGWEFEASLTTPKVEEWRFEESWDVPTSGERVGAVEAGSIEGLWTPIGSKGSSGSPTGATGESCAFPLEVEKSLAESAMARFGRFFL